MSVLEPVTRLEVAAVSDVPERRETDLVEAPDLVVVDHVRSHTVKCYWDFMECRWECSRD